MGSRPDGDAPCPGDLRHFVPDSLVKTVTLLGAIFAVAFIIGFARHRSRGLLAVTICGAPFSSSAMFAFGGNGVSPFYIGVILYIATSLLATIGKRGGDEAPKQRRSGLLIALISVVSVTAVAGPSWFEGMPVIAPGVGLDQQIATQTALSYSLSGLAQFGYLALALLLVHFNQKDRFVTRQVITTALAIGVAIAFVAYVFQMGGVAWPRAFFDNFPGNFYANGSERLRAQFAEPSQLGAFSLVALAYFATAAVVAKGPKQVIAQLALAGASALLLIASYSGTAIVGLVITLAIGAVIGVGVWIRNGARIPPLMFMAICLLLMVAALVTDDIVQFVIDAVEGKYGGTSFRNRGLANEIALRIFTESHYLGVGVGNNRASSLFPMLLSTIGAAGVFLFLLLVSRAIVSSVGILERLPLVLALAAQMAAAFTSLADFSSPVMWTLIAACYVADPEPRGTLGTRPAFRLAYPPQVHRRPIV